MVSRSTRREFLSVAGATVVGTKPGLFRADRQAVGLLLPAGGSAVVERSLELAWDRSDRAGDVEFVTVSDENGPREAIESLTSAGASVVVNATRLATSLETKAALEAADVVQFDVATAGTDERESRTYRIQPAVEKQAQDYVRLVVQLLERAGMVTDSIGFLHRPGVHERALLEAIDTALSEIANPRIDLETVADVPVHATGVDSTSDLPEPDVWCPISIRTEAVSLAAPALDGPLVVGVGGGAELPTSGHDGSILHVGPSVNPETTDAALRPSDPDSPMGAPGIDPVTVVAGTLAIAAVASGSPRETIADTDHDAGPLAMSGISFNADGRNVHAASTATQLHDGVPRVIYPFAYAERDPAAPLYFIDKEPPVIGGR